MIGFPRFSSQRGPPHERPKIFKIGPFYVLDLMKKNVGKFSESGGRAFRIPEACPEQAPEPLQMAFWRPFWLLEAPRHFWSLEAAKGVPPHERPKIFKIEPFYVLDLMKKNVEKFSESGGRAFRKSRCSQKGRAQLPQSI